MTVEFTELDEANRKVREWKREAKQSAPVSLAGGIDLTMCLDEMQIVVPPLSPFQVLRTSDILIQLVHIPSITTTAAASAAFGALVTLLFATKRSVTSVAQQGFLRRWAHRLLRIMVTAVASVVFARFLRERYPTVQRVSQYENLSRSPDGPCFVANRILTMTSSQAGTHADGPHHFCRSLSHRNYDDAHYSGDAVVLDITTELREHHQSLDPDAPLAITVEVLEKARVKLPAAFRDGSRPVWRLLLITRHSTTTSATRTGTTEALTEPLRVFVPLDVASATHVAAAGAKGATTAMPSESPSNAYAFLYPEAVDYLHRVFPRLVLLGIDSPSVDAPQAMPPGKHSHGSLLRCGIAILENLRYTRLSPLLESPAGDHHRGWISGSMLTVFNATQNYDDARGCSVIFFPEETR
ncbi:hypothetical protein, unknown function [Leishmania donovani]|uniref:Cyclase, putative n=1 Tax=Leishmania donovani TaxID=5661 RepID=A0A3S7X5K2_LEIDO|nr:hypothetical protein, unknown function [Leishmania donovani]AYU81695.1 Putative cyclase, putative [Leishmania donovani]TPP43659.1 putative cyclase family protein [Leishmania donovani]CBZ36878.1 hypothetical protein, unknown function [Leishmania donovani]